MYVASLPSNTRTILLQSLLLLFTLVVFDSCVPGTTGNRTGPASEDMTTYDFQTDYELDSTNFCPEDPPMAWRVVTPLDSACLCLLDNHPDTALTELKEAERKLRLFECLNESEQEYKMLEDIQMSLLRAELMIQKMEFEKAQDDLAMARIGFEKYYETIQIQ